MLPLSRWKLSFAVGLTAAIVGLSVGSDLPALGQEKKPDVKSVEPAAPKPTPEQKKEIERLIKQLAADDFDAREQAQKELEKVGPAALESLRLASQSSEAETKRRASELIVRLEEQLKSSKLLAPKKVHLNFKDVSVVDAVAQLTKQSGYAIQIGGDTTKLATRKITLDTGEVSFWEAFDKLCLAGGLVEPVADGKAAVGGLHVIEGTPKPMPTHYAGALRIRVLPDTVKRKNGVAEFMLEMAIEPRFRQPKVLGAAKVETALDDQGHDLPVPETTLEKPTLLGAPVALKLGDKQKTVKELSGSVLFETIMAGKMLAIDDVTKSAGKSVKNDEGATLRLDSYTKQPNGDVTIRATLSKALTPTPGVGIRIGPETFKEFQPELRDAHGLLFQKTAVPGQGISISGTMLAITQTINYRPQPGCGAPAELSLTSDKKTALRVPFSFKNLTLP